MVIGMEPERITRQDSYTLTFLVKQVGDKYSIGVRSVPPVEEIDEVALLSLATSLATEYARRKGADYTLEQIAQMMVALQPKKTKKSRPLKTTRYLNEFDRVMVDAFNTLCDELKKRGIDGHCGLGSDPKCLCIVLNSGSKEQIQKEFAKWNGFDVHVMYAKDMVFPEDD